MSSLGAARLIRRLENETVFEEIQLLNDEPVFKSVAGRHMIFRLRKREKAASAAKENRVPPRPDEPCRVVPALRDDAPSYSLRQTEIFQAGRIVVVQPAADQHLFDRTTPLAQSFETRQGVAENPPFVTRRMSEEFPGRYRTGAGVFVLTADEIAALNLTVTESALLRPYFETRAIKRYGMSPEPTHRLFYLTNVTCPTLDPFPNIREHLKRFRNTLERRREVQRGRIGWWHLHWPRDERIFQDPKVLCVQMGKRPQFIYSEHPAFVGFSVNLLLKETQGCSLPALTGILNSDLAFRWFERHAKRRGTNLEINGHQLRQFPLPARNEILEQELSQAVIERQAVAEMSQQATKEVEIEELVVRLYAQTGEETK
jgi:hypothetical protein